LQPVPIRAVYAIPRDHGEFKTLYFDPAAHWLRPNLTFVFSNGEVCVETNEIGLKGDPLDPARNLAVVWGDSVVFGVRKGWPCLLDDLVPGYQFLNGGIEGDSGEGIVERVVKLNRERAVAVNIILPGWHGNSYALKDCLTAGLAQVPNAVLATMPTSLNERLVHQEMSESFMPEDSSVGFYFHGSVEYSVAAQKHCFENILIRNAATRDAAAELDIPVIDLFRVFYTERVADFRQDFFDIAHPRPQAFPKICPSRV
jgi:hypothetical protein